MIKYILLKKNKEKNSFIKFCFNQKKLIELLLYYQLLMLMMLKVGVGIVDSVVELKEVVDNKLMVAIVDLVNN